MENAAEYVVIGGGEWGSHHTSLLLRAMSNGKLEPGTVRVVDRDPECRAMLEYGDVPLFRFTNSEWVPFLVAYMSEPPIPTAGQIVPSPHAPHLFLDWLEGYVRLQHPKARLTRRPFRAELSLPYQYSDADMNLYLSAAAWECPVSCREPRICPAIRAHRTWELGDIIRARAQSESSSSQPLVWRTQYVCPGVATVPVASLLEGASQVLQQPGRAGRAAVATVSACHGVVGLIEYELAGGASPCA